MKSFRLIYLNPADFRLKIRHPLREALADPMTHSSHKEIYDLVSHKLDGNMGLQLAGIENRAP